MKFERINYYIQGRFPAGRKYGIATKIDVTGYTAEELAGIAISNRGGWWYVDHIATGLGIVTVGSKTRAAAVAEYLTNYAERLQKLNPDTLKKAAEALAEMPTEDDAAAWEIVNYCTTKNWRFDRVTDAAKKAGLLVKKADDATYLDGGNINIIGKPEDLAEIRGMIEKWNADDAEKAQTEADEFFPVPDNAGRTFENYWMTAPETTQDAASAAKSPESAKAEEMHAEPEKAPETPQKHFAGQKILGRGWYIFFDPEEDRTRVIFERIPHPEVRKILKEAGFYWSPALMSWNKKLTFKAYRAAEKLAQDLQNVPPIKKQSGPKNPYYTPAA